MLTKRLLACANYVRPMARIIDVGTDHALLPCHLVKNGITNLAIAADINEGPLSRASDMIRKLHLEDKISTVLSDGLAEISAQSVDDIIIAGMGGELISQIILNCAWLKDSSKHLILQPMKRESYLRKSLYEQGFEILCETPIFENNHHYSAMLCVYCGECKMIDEVFALTGKIPEQKTLQLINAANSYLTFQAKRAEKIAVGLRHAENQSPESLKKAEKYHNLAKLIYQLVSLSNLNT